VQVYELIEKVAPTPSSVLITGESGTGKELVAKAIHMNSPRQDKPFITVNCAALAENLLESELFGHEKGAFTGAVVMRKGRFELADGGTLFLDEIGEIPLALQSKLLRALQEKSFERVGGSKTLSVDVRIISATNKDLREEVDQGRFREDLYYRLNVIHVLLPPLRERMDDIPILVEYFIRTVSERLAKPGLSISPDALRLLVTLPWEGNVRELENTIERAAILCDNNRIEADDVQPESSATRSQAAWSNTMDLGQLIPDSAELNDVLYAVEEKMLNRALEATGFVQARAAEKLGITKSLLQYKMKKYGIKKGR
jgi:two-component system NtrC family response regulator